MLEAKIDNSNDERLFADEKPKANNRDSPALKKRETAQGKAMQTLER